MTLKNYFTLIFLLLIKTFYSQESVLETEKINNFFNCDYAIYSLNIDISTSYPNHRFPVIIDTLNVCRVQKNKIKRLTIYYFKNSSDSTIWQDIEYKTNGLIQNMKPGIGWFIYADINPDKVNIDCNSLNPKNLRPTSLIEKKVNKEKQKREIYKYDSLGYLIEYTEIVKGIFNRWMYRLVAGGGGSGTVKKQTFYNYKNNYKTVAVSYCYLSRIKSKKCPKIYFDYIVCEFNETRNIVSEIKYKQDSNGKSLFVEGFKYYYSYFDNK